MKNAMQLKSLIRNVAKDKKISAHIVLQNYMLERLLERIAISKYKSNFILKGGFLIASMIGIDTRSTMDMDMTVKSIFLNKQLIKNVFKEICEIKLEDNIGFELINISEIRENDKYNGYRIHLKANYSPLSVPLKIDVTTGDKITPKEITYNFKLIFENRSISILSYNLETIIAEKLETIISRGNLNTRIRDYYDIYILYKLKFDSINYYVLQKAFYETINKRNTFELSKSYNSIMNSIVKSELMNNRWISYQQNYEYAKDISFEVICISIMEILNKIM